MWRVLAEMLFLCQAVMIPYYRLGTYSNFSFVSGPEHGHETALEFVSGANFVGSAPFFEPGPLERV